MYTFIKGIVITSSPTISTEPVEGWNPVVYVSTGEGGLTTVPNNGSVEFGDELFSLPNIIIHIQNADNGEFPAPGGSIDVSNPQVSCTTHDYTPAWAAGTTITFGGAVDLNLETEDPLEEGDHFVHFQFDWEAVASSGTYHGTVIIHIPEQPVSSSYKIVVGTPLITAIGAPYPDVSGFDSHYNRRRTGILGLLIYRVVDTETGARQLIQYLDWNGDGLLTDGQYDITSLVVGEGADCNILFAIISQDSDGTNEVVTKIGLSAVTGEININSVQVVNDEDFGFELVTIETDDDFTVIKTENVYQYLNIPDPVGGTAIISLSHNIQGINEE